MPRFAVTAAGGRIEVSFDDGGMNLLSKAALLELREVVREAGRSGAGLLVFRSVRPGLFAAGADIAEMSNFTAAEAREFSELGQELFAAISRLPAVTAAVIDGDCFGGALDLVLAFDFRLATPRSRFAHPGARLGIVTGFGGTTRWRQLLSRPAANRLFLANTILTADEALQLQLVDRTTDDIEEELARLQSIDPAEAQLVKILTNCADRLTRSQLLLLSERLGQLYFRRSSKL